MYEQFQQENGHVRIHSHDRNSSVSKFLNDNQPATIDNYDTWHGAKEVKRYMAKITKGAQKNSGKYMASTIV